MDPVEENRQLYLRYRGELMAKRLSNSQALDRSILTLSSSALSLTLVFTKSLFLHDQPFLPWLLVGSWISFSLAIFSTLVSFHVARIGLKEDIDYAEQYYLGDQSLLFKPEDESIGLEDESLKALSRPRRFTEGLNYSSSIFFFLGTILLILFSSLNIF